jgi:hypothetical protein
MKMKSSPAILAALLAMAAFGLVSCGQSGQTPAETAEKTAALKDALKNGVITQQEYDAKVAQLSSGGGGVDPQRKAALDKAMKDGLLTQAEYDAKLRALTAAPPAETRVSAAPTTVLAASPPAAASTGVRKEAIRDPGFNMTAFDVTVPANWKFEGTFVPGSSCFQSPFPVVRAYSPDGLTEWRRYPRMDWTWTNMPGAPGQAEAGQAPSHPDCLSLKQELSAQDFLKYIMGVLQIAYVRDGPVPQATIDAKQKLLDQLNASAAANSRILKLEPAVQKAGFAAAYGEYRNGSFTIEAHLYSQVDCIRTPLPGLNQKGKFAEACNATLRVVRAPKGQLEGVLARFAADRIGAFDNMQWVTRYLNAFREHSEEMARQRQAEFDRAQAVRAEQHQQFLATMQEGTDRSMARATEAANARHTIASDWCDYALDQQTVTGPGGTAKVSSSFNHTWTDGAGNYFQTNDPSANPNGVFTGNWSQATKVHGDGTPY